MSTIVRTRKVGGQNCVNFSTRSYWMTNYLLALHIFHIFLYQGILYAEYYNLGQICNTWILRMKACKNSVVFLDKKVLKMILDYYSWYLIDLDVSNIEYWLFWFQVRLPEGNNNKYLNFTNWHFQSDELPRK